MRSSPLFIIIAVLTITLSPGITPTSASVAKIQIQAITDSKTGEVQVTFLSKIPKNSVASYEIIAKPIGVSGLRFSKIYNKKVTGYINQKVSPLSPGVAYEFTVNQRTVDKKISRSNPYVFTLEPTSPSAPRITGASPTDSDEAVIFFDAPLNDGGTPILSYTVTANPGQIITTSNQQVAGSITALGLTKATTYTFTITAQNLYGRSEPSLVSPAVTTLAQKIVRSSPVSTTQTNTAPPLAAPAFTLSSSAETRVATTVLVGYTITSTGGTIASYSLTGSLPAGLSFSASTGLITGTPTETKTATTYTITATNASGTASNSFRLRVTGDIGDIGPGGGKIFYYRASGFSCGPTLTSTCKYLEVSPNNWNTGSEPKRTWSQSGPPNYQNSVVGDSATATAIGWGYRNTRAIVGQGNADSATSAAALADSYTVTVSSVAYDDWYLPSTDELNQMCKWARGQAWISDATACSASGTINVDMGFVEDWYWSSTENNSFSSQSRLFSTGGGGATNKNVSQYVRAIRAF